MLKTKEVNYERLMDALYCDLCNENLCENTIETEELNEAYDNFYDKYIEPIYKQKLDEGIDVWDEFNDVVYGYCRSGFEVGFQAAITLLTKMEVQA